MEKNIKKSKLSQETELGQQSSFCRLAVNAAIANRFSCRSYLENVPIEQAQLDVLIAAAQQAPTDYNRQDLNFYFIQSEEKIEELNKLCLDFYARYGDPQYVQKLEERGGKFFYGASLIVLLAGPAEEAYSPLNAGIAAQTLCLSATGLGLGSVIMGSVQMPFHADWEKREDLKNLVYLEESEKVFLAVALGKWDEKGKKEPHRPTQTKIVLL